MKGPKNKKQQVSFPTPDLLKDNALYLNKKRSTMEIEQRNKLAAIMFDIKHKIKDGEYKEFMDILGKKEAEPNLENIRIVKLHYIDCEYLSPFQVLDAQEGEWLLNLGHSNDCDDMFEFKQERLRREVKTQIVEIYGKLEEQFGDCSISKAMRNSCLHVTQLKVFISQTDYMKPDQHEGSQQMTIHDTRWIHPLKYTVMDKKEN